MSENNKKTPRTFQCRDALWEKFEEMARELECSVDYLINDSMKQYARQRGFAAGASASASAGQPVSLSSSPPKPELSSPIASSPRPMPLPAPVPPVPSTPAHAPPPIPGRSLPAPPIPPPLGIPGARASLPSLGAIARPAGPGGPQTIPLPPNRLPPLPGGNARLMPPAPGQKPGTRALVVHFEGEEYPVDKDQFIIGRGKQVSDLTIRDPNISRQHAAIEFSAGTYWMVDMGSTNGVEFNGQRVQRKQIQNGEIYRICSHELLMSLT